MCHSYNVDGYSFTPTLVGISGTKDKVCIKRNLHLYTFTGDSLCLLVSWDSTGKHGGT